VGSWLEATSGLRLPLFEVQCQHMLRWMKLGAAGLLCILIGSIALLAARSFFVHDCVRLKRTGLPQIHDGDPSERTYVAHSSLGILTLVLEDDCPRMSESEALAAVPRTWSFQRYSNEFLGPPIERSTTGRSSRREVGPFVTGTEQYRGTGNETNLQYVAIPIWPAIPLMLGVTAIVLLRGVRRAIRSRQRGFSVTS
jgi:hypothetical protein